jgi:hypothetical protein
MPHAEDHVVATFPNESRLNLDMRTSRYEHKNIGRLTTMSMAIKQCKIGNLTLELLDNGYVCFVGSRPAAQTNRSTQPHGTTGEVSEHAVHAFVGPIAEELKSLPRSIFVSLAACLDDRPGPEVFADLERLANEPRVKALASGTQQRPGGGVKSQEREFTRQAIKTCTIGHVRVVLLDDDTVVYMLGNPEDQPSPEKFIDDLLQLPPEISKRLIALSKDNRSGVEKFAEIEQIANEPRVRNLLS